MRNPRAIQWVTIITAMALAAGTDAAVASAPPGDSQIQAQVAHKLEDHHIRRGNNPQVTAKDGTVSLTGQVQSLWEKNEAIKLARQTEGVQMVVSELTIARAESDKVLAEEMSKRVLRYSHYTVYDDVNAVVRDGVITLTGAVTAPFKADDLADSISRIRGVQDLKNELKALPVSQSDEHLRIELSNRIFGNPNFTTYATQVNPPIHIIVEYGRVVLKGYVNSALDRQQAEAIVRGTPGVRSVDNQLQVTRG